MESSIESFASNSFPESERWQLIRPIETDHPNIVRSGRYNDTIVSSLPDELGKDTLHKEGSNAHTRMPTASGLSSGLTMTLPACKSVCHSTGNDISSGGRKYRMTASNWFTRRIWKSGEASRVERDMTSSTDREGASSLSHFCWILMIQRQDIRPRVQF